MPEKMEARLGGATVFWSLDTTNREKLVEGLKSLGLSEFTPEPKTPAACLRHALTEAFPAEKDKKIVIRPLEGDGQVGFGVGWLPPKARENDDYTPICVAVVEGSSAGGITITGDGWRKLSDVQDAYREAMATFSASTVATMLVKIVENLGGVTLRPKGGFYWLSKDMLDAWESVASMVEKCATEGSESHVYTMEFLVTENTIRAVGHALNCEIGREVSRIEDEMAGDEHDLCSCERHIKQCNTLLGKIERFETCFEIPLTKLREYLEATTQHSAIAALRSSGAALVSSAA